MRTGATLSAAGHGAILALVVFGMPWFSAPDAPAIRVTEVSFVSEEDFAAAQSAAQAPRDPEAAPEAPAPAREVVLDEPALPQTADRPAPAPEPAPVPEVATLAPEFNAAAPLAAPPEGVTLIAPPVTSLAVVGPPRPRPVERIDPTPAPAPPEVAQPAETVTPEQSAEPAPERLAAAAPTAPPEAAPEPQSAPAETPAPVAPSGAVQSSAPPRPRPVAPPAPQQVAAAPAPTPPAPEAPAAPPTPPTPAAPPAPAAPSQAEMILQRMQAAQGEGAAPATSLPLGDPITGAEREGLKLAVQRCWNVPAGLRDAQDLRVTLAAELDPQGAVIAGSIRLIEPASAPDARFQQAYEAGRRALIRCSPYTEMPREKYARWRNIEVVFNPEGMVSW